MPGTVEQVKYTHSSDMWDKLKQLTVAIESRRMGRFRIALTCLIKESKQNNRMPKLGISELSIIN